LPAFAAEAVQLDTPVGPVVIGAGQVVVVQLLPELAAAAVQVSTGTFVVLLVEQVVVVYALPEVAAEAVQAETGTLVVLFVEQVVAV
jgi:hypothetical protein